MKFPSSRILIPSKQPFMWSPLQFWIFDCPELTSVSLPISLCPSLLVSLSEIANSDNPVTKSLSDRKAPDDHTGRYRYFRALCCRDGLLRNLSCSHREREDAHSRCARRRAG